MNTYKIIVIQILAFSLAGCHGAFPGARERATQNAWMVRHIRESAVNRAIVMQHTIYPYHFESQGAALNALGVRDLEVLAGHYKEDPGQLNIPQGDVSDRLYSARVASVVTALAKDGVQKDRITISSTALPGGTGMSSERVLLIYRTEAADQSGPSDKTVRSSLSQGDPL